MRFFYGIAISLLLTACATTDYQPYEGKSTLYEGEGGTKVVVDGIDFRANGAPPRKYKILGIVASEVGSGYVDEAMIRSAVASEVKKNGGTAAVQISNNTLFSGILRTSTGSYLATNAKRMQFAVVSYMP